MDQQFWIKKWEKQEIGFDQRVPNRWLEHYSSQFGELSGKRVFVPLCGKSIDMHFFANRGAEVIGVELSPLAIEQFEQERPHPNVQLLCGDLFELTQERIGPIDFVYDRAALIALPEAIRPRYAATLKRLCSPKTKLWINTLDYTSDKPLKPPYPVSDTEVRALFSDTYQIEVIHHDPEVELAAHLHSRGMREPVEWIFWASNG